jgi:hypothetical protein
VAGYGEWSEGFRELWDDTSGTEYIDAWEQDWAQELFDLGFGHTASEYDALGITPDDVFAAREEFFDYMGLADDQFDWDAWREEMYGDT